MLPTPPQGQLKRTHRKQFIKGHKNTIADDGAQIAESQDSRVAKLIRSSSKGFKQGPFPMSIGFGNQPAPYRGLSDLSGPKCRKVSKMSPGLRPRNPEKSPKSLQNSLGSLRKVSKESFFGLFPRLFGDFRVPGPEGLGDIVETFSAFRARRAQLFSSQA